MNKVDPNDVLAQLVQKTKQVEEQIHKNAQKARTPETVDSDGSAIQESLKSMRIRNSMSPMELLHALAREVEENTKLHKTNPAEVQKSVQQVQSRYAPTIQNGNVIENTTSEDTGNGSKPVFEQSQKVQETKKPIKELDTSKSGILSKSSAQFKKPSFSTKEVKTQKEPQKNVQ